MRLLWLSLFVLLTTTTLRADEQPREPAAGTLTGQFLYDGEPPKAVEFVVPRSQGGEGTTVVDESLVVDPKTRSLRNVVVMLYGDKLSGDKRPAPIYPGGKAPPLKELPLTSSLPRFDPHVLAVRTTQKLNIVNPLTVPQNFKLEPRENDAINVLVKPRDQFQFVLDKNERLPARFTDSVYPWKSGYLMITDHPFVAVSDAQGKFTIDYLPPGEWTFRVWQEKTGYVENVACKPQPGPWPKGQFKAKIKPGVNDLGEIKVSPTEFTAK